MNTRKRSNSGSGSPYHPVDRYKHDLAQAKALQRARITEKEVLLALDELERVEGLRENNPKEALKRSESALSLLIRYLKDPSVNVSGLSKEVLRSRVELALSDAESIKQTLASHPSKNPNKTNSLSNMILKKLSFSSISPSSSNQSTSPKTLPNISAKLSSDKTPKSSPAKQLFNSQDPMVDVVKSELYVDQSQLDDTSWNDIAGLKTAKQSLQEAAILPLIRPDLFTGLRKPQNILLYGPPGTGKTMLVKAVAKESESLLFICTASSLTSKWHGEGEKLLRTLFQVARAAAPSIIFIDEMDALLSSRKSEGEHEASRRFKTEFMTQMDGIVKGADTTRHLLLIACTNCPWDIDSAVLRRFPRRIYIPLPDQNSRAALLKNLLQKASKHNLTSQNIASLARRLDGYSGSDIASIASEASFGPLRSLGSVSAIRSANANKIRPINFHDFEQAIDQATRSTSQDLLRNYEQWKKDQGG